MNKKKLMDIISKHISATECGYPKEYNITIRANNSLSTYITYRLSGGVLHEEIREHKKDGTKELISMKSTC